MLAVGMVPVVIVVVDLRTGPGKMFFGRNLLRKIILSRFSEKDLAV